MIKLDAVKSSNVVSIGHDGKETMFVRYRGDSFYNFEGAQVEDFDNLKKSKSIGSGLHRIGIKGTKIITSKCPKCGHMAMIETTCQNGDGKTWQCQDCNNLEPCEGN